MTALVGIAGSLRSGSFNRQLLVAARAALPLGTTLEIVELHGIPLYDADLEAREGIPAAVQAFKDRLANADGVLVATPEYNNSIPGVLKNAIDWASRPPADIPRVFGRRPFALLGASAGGFGTILSQAAWLPVLKTLGAEVWAGRKLLVSRAAKAFDDAGGLAEEQARAQLAAFVQEFTSFAAARRAR